ncbi:hypothetical protein JCM3765_004465 [Sporobolomyces pararoseus]
MSEPQTKQVEPVWQPPTPNSSQIGFHSPKLPVDHLVLLPPPLIQTSRDGYRRSSSSDQGCPHPFYPSELLPPLRLPEASLRSDPHTHPPQPCEPPSIHSAVSKTRTTTWEEEYTKRPRRSAAIVAERRIPRQPSPLELDSDDATFSPPPMIAPSASNSARTSKEPGGGGASKRKVSHSLIERRRREKINDCLATLKDTVPNLREEGAKKIAKAKERGRKRGRGDDTGERGGLHKLEILQGTIEYITELRARIDQLEQTEQVQFSSQTSSETSPLIVRESPRPPPSTSIQPPSLSAMNSFDSSSASVTTSTSPDESLPPITTMSRDTMSREEADHAASMLLYFSTSPELRPVRM